MRALFLLLFCFTNAFAASNSDRTVNAKYIKNGSALLTVPTTTGVMITRTSTDTLTNKSIDATTNTISNISNTNVSTSAAISYSKLNLSNSITNTDVSTGAAISYSKLNLAGSIVNTDVSTSAAIDRSKIASGTAYHVVVNDSSGNMVTGVAPGTSGNVLTSNGTSWTSTAPTAVNENYVSFVFAGDGSGTSACSSDPCTTSNVKTNGLTLGAVNRSGAGVYTIAITGCSAKPKCIMNGDPNHSGNQTVQDYQTTTTSSAVVYLLTAGGSGADGVGIVRCECD